MRLINVETYKIHEFFGNKIPKYAILSHTWGEEEVTLQEMTTMHGAGPDIANPRPYLSHLSGQISSKQGYKKIMYTCQQARKDKLNWAWVDTCCIDKTSSAELSEAINSMYQWYKESSVCYAYLSDVLNLNLYKCGLSGPYLNVESSLKSSRWFKRGWTLQELIAPTSMKFFDTKWCCLGSRWYLSTVISNITHIPASLIGGGEKISPSLNDFSVAQKMSWAARRKCTRIEDIAYCLMGIFDINMPLLYGEGDKAFLRLQEEIFRTTDDHSLLAWTMTPESDLRMQCWTPASVFAKSPLDFLNSGDIVRLHEEAGAPSLVTKKGLQISLPLVAESPLRSRMYRQYCAEQMFHAILNCGTEIDGKPIRILLLVFKDDGSNQAIKQSRSYSRLLTRQHLGIHDQKNFQDSSGYETIFLRTSRHNVPAFQPWHVGQPRMPLQIHVHNIDFDSIKDKMTNPVMKYTVKEVSYGGTAIDGKYRDIHDVEKIIAEGFFFLKIQLHSSVDLPCLEASFQIERHGIGLVQADLCLVSSSGNQRYRPTIASQYFHTGGFTGNLLCLSLCLGDFFFDMTLHCDEVGSGPYIPIHVHLSFKPIVPAEELQIPTELSHRTWGKRDFFSLFERTRYFLSKQRQIRFKYEINFEIRRQIDHLPPGSMEWEHQEMAARYFTKLKCCV